MSPPTPPFPSPDLSGTVIGSKFALLRRLADGGVGSVYEARDELIGRTVALKMLHPGYARNPEAVARFKQEAHVTASVRHPNVVTIHEMGRRRDGSFYIVQELLTGVTLRDHLTERGKIPAVEALNLMLPIMRALVVAHREGVVHRDVKPENIVLLPGSVPTPKLIDFGIAKLRQIKRTTVPTQLGLQIGTPSYMSPEQARGEAVIDGRTDIWAAGVVLIELITGRQLFPGPSEAVTYVQLLSERQKRVAEALREVPPGLHQGLDLALRDSLSERWRRMDLFADELTRWRDRQPQPPDSAQAPSAYEPAGGSERLQPAEEIEPAEEPDEWLSVADLSIGDLTEEALPDLGQPDDEAPPSSRHDARFPPSPELAWRSGAAVTTPRGNEEARADAAELALGHNALEVAISLAEGVLANPTAGHRGRMHLVNTIACLWLGRFNESYRHGTSAMAHFELGSTGWYSAFGHVVTTGGMLGHESIGQLHQNLLRRLDDASQSPARDVACYRLAIVLARRGEMSAARSLLQAVDDRTEGTNEVGRHSLVHAWADVARSEMFNQAGDPSGALPLVQSAVGYFALAGDLRNACLQRHNVGSLLAQLGAYAQAEKALREVLEVAAPMKLYLVGAAYANLGLVLARLGKLDEATELEIEALRLAHVAGDRRFGAVANIYFALILTQRGELDRARRAASEAIEQAAAAPPLLAYAHGVLAGILLLEEDAALALQHSRTATQIVLRLGGIEEGEIMVRLVHMSALAGTGQQQQARQTIAEARQRLLQLAKQIGSEAWRRSYLERVPENAQALSLAAQWLDPAAAGKEPVPELVVRLKKTALGLGTPRKLVTE